MALRQRPCPIQQLLVFWFAQLIREGLKALVVVVIPDRQTHTFSPAANFCELGEKENQRTNHQANFLPPEKHIRARRKNRYALRLKELCQLNHFLVLDRTEQKGNLIPVLKLAGIAQLVKERQYFIMPVGSFSIVIASSQAHDCRGFWKLILTGKDFLGEAELALAIFPFNLIHPLVVEADNFWM